MLATRDPCLEIDRAHVHYVEGVLVLELDIGYQPCVHGDEGAEVGHVADAQDDGALLECEELFAGELLGEFEEVGVCAGVRGQVEGEVVGGGGGGGGVVPLGFGDGEEELVFPVAADTGCAKVLDELDDARGVGACTIIISTCLRLQ